jgi:ApaG protein
MSITEITSGIRVSVKTAYRQDLSDSSRTQFLFSYQITISNESDYTVQLLRRSWLITDADGSKREVEGEGVVGEQPILPPGQAFTYESACNLMSEIGKMSGTYLMERKADNGLFRIKIPEFHMTVPHKLN